MVDISLPNVSYCKDIKDVHYLPYNLVRFYVGNITGTTPQTVSIYTNETTSVNVQVSEGNKWYSYVIPKDKGLYQIVGDSVKKVVVKADINGGETIIPSSTVEASFKGSDTSKVTDMSNMFTNCSGLTSLDVSNFNTSNVTNMFYMFGICNGLTSLDLSSFDTSNVTDMSSMFFNCSGLTSLDLSGWKFGNNSFYHNEKMFQGCSRLEFLDLSGWNIGDAEYDMFNGCKSLTTIRMKGCSEDTINNIKERLFIDGINNVKIVTK